MENETIALRFSLSLLPFFFLLLLLFYCAAPSPSGFAACLTSCTDSQGGPCLHKRISELLLNQIFAYGWMRVHVP